MVNYEKQISKTYYTANRKESTRELLGKVLDSINIAKEIADGLRVIFDFNLRAILLYGSHGEVKQYNEVMKPGKVQKRTSISPHLPSTSSEKFLSIPFLAYFENFTSAFLKFLTPLKFLFNW